MNCGSGYVEPDSGTLVRCIYEESHDGEHCAPLYIHWFSGEQGVSEYTHTTTDMEISGAVQRLLDLIAESSVYWSNVELTRAENAVRRLLPVRPVNPKKVL